MGRAVVVIVCLFLFINVAVCFAGQDPQIPKSGEPAVRVAPVRIDDMTLFHVRGIEAFPAEDRAKAIGERIKEIASDPAVKIESITAVEAEFSTDLVADGRRIMSVFDADASFEGVPRQVVAKAVIAKLRTSIQKYRQDRTPESIARGAGYSLLATIGFIVALVLLRKLYRKTYSILESRYKSRIGALHIQSLEFVQAERIWTAVTGALQGIRLVLLLVVFYVYFHLVMGFFPWTRLLAANLFNYVLMPLETIGKGILKHIPNLIFVLILIFLTRYLLKFMRLVFAGIENKTLTISGFDPDWARPTYRIVRFLIVAFAVIVAYPYIPGSESPAFKGISIFVGVLFSLGSSSALSNIIAGYTMTYRRAFKVGDRIKVDDVTGDVTEVRLLVTHLRTIKNEEVIVPNATILNSQIVNFSTFARERGLILHTAVGIGYEVPWRQVEAMMLMAAERTSGLLREPKPFVLQKSLGDFAVTYELNVYVDDPHGMAQTYSELHKNVLDAFNEYGVQIMTPAYEGDPDQPKVVPKEQWFAAPANPSEDKGGKTE